MSVKTAPAQLAAAGAESRGQRLRDLLELLHPDCSTGDPGSPKVAEYLVLPDARHPQLLVPMDSRRVAVAAMRGFSEPLSLLARFKRDAMVMALRSGIWPAPQRDRVRLSTGRGEAGGGIDDFLRQTLRTELSMSVHIGLSRAGRKAVLQLLDPAGKTIGFAKLGTGPLTRRLVRAETAALTALSHGRLTTVAAPKVLHAGQWRRHQLLVQSPLPIWRPREQLTPRRLTEAMLEVAGSCGITQGWLATSPYWNELRSRLSPWTGQEGVALGNVAASLIQRCSDLGMRYGAWHGDWAPSNMASVDGTLLVWNWERFSPGVPLGFDALHHDMRKRLAAGVEPGEAAEQTVRNAAGLLSHFSLVPGSAETTALLYLIELAARDLADRGTEPQTRPGVPVNRLLPVLVERVGRL